MKKTIKYFSIFSGIEGFGYGIEKAFSNKQVSEIIKNKKGRNRNPDERQSNVRNRSST
jgi:hypothetical protein